jgi:iron complex outermembrane receptor protein
MKISVSYLSFAITATLLSSVSYAETGRVIEEVLVQAQKRTQTLQEVPASISTISGDDLEKSNTTSFSDLSKITPGLYVNDTGDGDGQSVNMRGVGVGAYISNLRPAITFFIDEVPLSRLDSAFANFIDLERIEVLKGPQSTLYGKEVAAGAILITTRKPQLGVFEGGVGAQATADPDGWEYSGKINVPVGDQFAMRLVAYQRDGEGELENVLTGKKRSDKNIGGRISFLWQPLDTLQFGFSHDQHKIEVRDSVRERVTYGLNSQPLIGGAITLPADPFDDQVEVAVPAGRDISMENTSFTMEWDFSDTWSLKSTTGHQVFDRQLNKGGVLASAGEQVGGDAAWLPVPFLPFHSDASPGDESSLSQEFRVAYEGKSWSSIYGAFYSKVDIEEATSVLAGSTPLVTARSKSSVDWSVYMHHTYSLNETWDFVFGLRYGESKLNQKNLTSFFTGFFGDGTFPLGPEKKEIYENISGTFKVVYKYSDDISFYTGLSQGYKPGGFNDAAGAPNFDQEKSDNWELGMKSNFFDRTLRINANVFYQAYNDYQVQEFNPNSASGLSNILSNAAAVDVYGLEADFLWLATERITIDGAFSYVDARYDEYSNASCSDEQKVALTGTASGSSALGCTSIQDSTTSPPNGFQDLSGKRLSQNSPWTFNLNVQYDDQLDSGWGWYIRGEMAFKDDFFGYVPLDGLAYQSSYTLYNARVALMDENKGWEVALFGKNLADEDYIAGFFPGRDGALGVVGIKGDGRTFGVSAKYKF